MAHDALTKLIEDNKWRPIAEASKDDDFILGMTIASKQIVLVRWCEEKDAWETETLAWYGKETLSHFRPLPDDRLARAFEVAIEELQAIALECDCRQNDCKLKPVWDTLDRITAISDGKEW